MSTKDFSNIQEHKVAEFLGWNIISGSGSRACRPGDIYSNQWLGECKTHIDSGHKIEFKYSVWCKIADEAASKFKFPVLIVDDGSQRIDHTWCLIDMNISVPYGAIVKPLNISINKNIVISHDELMNHICTDKLTILCVKLKNYNLGICRLSDFNLEYGE